MIKYAAGLSFLAAYASQAVTCGFVHDPRIFNRTAEWGTLIEAFANPKCDAVIMIPPIPSLGGLSDSGLTQTVVLQPRARRDEILRALRSADLEVELEHASFSIPKFLRAKAELQAKVRPDQVEWTFHGAPGLVAVGDSWEPSTYFTDNQLRIIQRPAFTRAEILTLFGGNLEALEHAEKKLTHDGKNFRNPCWEIAQRTKLTTSPEKSLMKRFEPLADKIGYAEIFKDSMTKETACPAYRELKDAFYRIANNQDRLAECPEIFRSILAEEELKSCIDRRLIPNLLVENPLDFGGPDAHHLISACSIGLESLSGRHDRFHYQLLQGCPQIADLEAGFAKLRAGVLQESVNNLCKGQAGKPHFTVSLDVAFGVDEHPAHPVPIQRKLLPGEKQYEGAIKILGRLDQLCEPEVAPLIPVWQSLSDFRNGEDWLAAPQMNFVKIRERIEEISCGKHTVSATEKDQLRIQLIEKHLDVMQRSLMVSGRYKLRSSREVVHGPDYSPAALRELQALPEKLKSIYERLELGTTEQVLKAYKRLEYLAVEQTRGLGFYDCYHCENGKPVKEDCDGAAKKFSGFNLMGDRNLMNAVKDPAKFTALFEQSAREAEKIAPPVCRPDIPPCDFSKDPQCKLKIGPEFKKHAN